MELKHLRAFVTLTEELHFGRAAARLHIVQPALSAQIRVLEEHVGALLFERDRHKVVLTEEGGLLLPEALATLHQAERAREVVQRSASGAVGVLRIAFVSSVLSRLLPGLLRAMSERLPGIDLELKDMPTPLQVRALQDNSLDFGLVRLPLAHAGVNTRWLFEEQLVVALAADDPLCSQRQVQPSDLAERAVLVLARKFAPGLYDQMLVAFHKRKVTLQIARELGEFTTMLALVAAGWGLGVLPAGAASALPPGVVTRPLALNMAGTGIGIAWTALDSPRKRAFIEVLDGLYPPS
ncbi:LysR family transcriptional regulator [Pseudomonas abieticivorans]|uniref:LysR family transcriptional regulator n=1 Tax=Pseudomonas abieticivorans TaxID=2931382 RepID=UPI0020C14D90|nr:LysR family transcriptional regulator [Pseudomonas sp. PIA16]